MRHSNKRMGRWSWKYIIVMGGMAVLIILFYSSGNRRFLSRSIKVRGDIYLTSVYKDKQTSLVRNTSISMVPMIDGDVEKAYINDSICLIRTTRPEFFYIALKDTIEHSDIILIEQVKFDSLLNLYDFKKYEFGRGNFDQQ